MTHPQPIAKRFTLQRICLAGLQWQQSGADGIPVLCLHGWLDNAASFQLMAPLLCASRAVTSVDLPGHGYSDHRPEGYGYTLLDYVQDLADLVDRIGQPVHIVAHSLGGIVSSLFAATRPEHLQSLTLIDSLGPYVARAEDFPERLGRGLAKALAHGRKPMPVYESVEAAEKAREGGVLPLSSLAARQLVSRNLRPVDGGWTWRTDSQLRLHSLSALTEEQVLANLSAIAVPVLLLQAEDGLVKSDDRYRRRIAAVKRIEHRRVPGTHHLHLDGDLPLLSGIIDNFLHEAEKPENG